MGLAIALSILMPRTVRADSYPYCDVLSRSPVFLDRDVTTRCLTDEDGNGLDDEVEQQLAECFAPQFRFDSDEPSASLLPGEPVTGFAAYRIQSPNPADVVIRFELAIAWRRDGGFASDDSAACGNDHDGDTTGMRIDVRVFKDVVWRAQLVHFSDCSPSEISGTHPVVYPTAGKHHIRCSPGTSWYDVTGPGECKENHRGDGSIRTPTGLFRVPFSRVPIEASDGNLLWGNVCTYVRTGQKVVGQRLQPNRLDNLGFAGKTLTGCFYSCGGTFDDPVTPIGNFLEPGAALTSDADDDTRNDVDMVDWDHVVAEAVDRCPLGGGPQLDEDGDHLVGQCDPDPNFQQTWVGVGTLSKPAVPLSPYWYASSSFAYGGFLDTDQDGVPEGVDGCPSLHPNLIPKGGITATNRWGEDQNWPPDPYANNLLGALQRDAMCDPYPVAHTQWNAKTKTFSKCQPAGFVSVGQDAIGLTTRVSRGVSANDPFWNAPKLETPKVFIGQTHRCACRDFVTGAPLVGAACTLDLNSECYRASARPAGATTAVGRGWRPVDRQGCPRDAGGWCTKLSYVVPRFDSVISTASWRWRDKVAAFGALSTKPHFAASDVDIVPASFTTTAHTRLTHDYATWTLPDISSPPSTSQKAVSSFFYDPEYDPLHRAEALWDVQSLDSLRLRSSFSEKPVAALSSQHSEFYPGLPCTTLTLDQQLVKVQLWFGPDPVAPERTVFADVRALAHDEGVLARAALLRPHEGGYAGVVLGLTAAQGWLATSPVIITPIVATTSPVAFAPAGVPQIGSATRAAIAEPGILALERDATRPRWALLYPSVATETLVVYEQREGGSLPAPVSATAQLVADAAGETAALVDFTEARFDAFSPESHTWTRRDLPAALLGIDGAAIALWGSKLLAAGGLRQGVPTTELWQIDLFSGAAVLLRSDLPARRGARLAITPRGESVILNGGVDAQAARYDDVWQLVPFTRPPLRLFSDTTLAVDYDFARGVVFDAPFEGLVRAVSFDGSRAAHTVSRVRTTAGWEEATVAGEAAACPPGDAVGGSLCALDPAWWATPGRVPCNATECQRTAGTLEVAAAVPGPGAVVDADVDELSVWVVRSKSLERWRFDVGTAPVLLASAPLPAKARAVAASATGALVATDAGVLLGQSSEAGFDLEGPLQLCGRALRVERLSDTTWAIATTLGLAVVAGGAGAPLELHSMSLLMPGSPNLIALGTQPNAIQSCNTADAGLTAAVVDGLNGVTSLAHVAQRLLVASGPTLYEVTVADPAAPSFRSKLDLAQPLQALRVDPTGLRAYGVAPSAQHRVLVDLRADGLSFSGTHDIVDWVRRRDSERLRVRITANKAELARVTP